MSKSVDGTVVVPNNSVSVSIKAGDIEYEAQYHPKAADIVNIFSNDPIKKINEADNVNEEEEFDEEEGGDQGARDRKMHLPTEGEFNHYLTSTPDNKIQDNTPLHEAE